MGDIWVIPQILQTISQNVSHYQALKRICPYFVWAEDGEAATVKGDNKFANRALTGTIDLFTKAENDPLVAQCERALEESGISWSLNSVQFEQTTGIIHHEWAWEV